MKANNLAICVPDAGCNKNCSYCISKMTTDVKENWALMHRNISKVIQFAKLAQITSVLFTGKGEPTLSWLRLEQLAQKFYQFPLELQTNGLYFLEEKLAIPTLSALGFDIIAISIDCYDDLCKLKSIIKKIASMNMIVRLTTVITDIWDMSLDGLMQYCMDCGVRQVSFRNATIPKIGLQDHAIANKVVDWILDHNHDGKYEKIVAKLSTSKYPIIRNLPYGAKIIDYNGISVAWFDYCVQDKHTNDDIRSLIFKADGHLYSTWSSKASIIF